MQRPDLNALGARDPESGAVQVVIDTPSGSRNKYKYDEAKGLFRLHKVLPLGARFRAWGDGAFELVAWDWLA